MVGVSSSVNLTLHHKVQKFSSGTGSPGWSRKMGRKTFVVWWWNNVSVKSAATIVTSKALYKSTYLLTHFTSFKAQPHKCTHRFITFKASSNICKYLRIFHGFNIRSMRVLDLCCLLCIPLPSSRHHRSSVDCLEGKGENYQVCSVQYCVQQLCTVQCTHI